MATYVLVGFRPADIQIEGGGGTLAVGSRFKLAPTWNASIDRYTFTITDDDTIFGGDASAGEVGDDSTQTVIVRDAAGATVSSGRIYQEYAATFTAPDGSTIRIWSLEVGGTVVGYVTSAPIDPGVTFQVATLTDTSASNSPAYSSIVSATYDPDTNNTLVGGQFNDTLLSGAGNDTVYGGLGNDSVQLGTGDDRFGDGSTEGGNDTIFGGDGNDNISAGGENDVVYGDDGNDTLSGDAGSDSIYGGLGNDLVQLGTGDDLFGDLSTDGGKDTIYGGDGNDNIDAGGDNDVVYGDAGNDSLSGGVGSDSIYGGAGSDQIFVSDDHKDDYIDGGSTGADWDVIWFDTWASTQGIAVTFSGTGAGSYDYLGTDGAGTFTEIEGIGGTQYADSLNASADAGGMDLFGNAGNDTITGGSGDDWLDGGAGNDSLSGNAGWDEFNGGAGNDTMSGGADGDIFWIDQTSGTDSVSGGETGADQDTLSLSDRATGGVTVTYTGIEAGSYDFDGTTAAGSFTGIEMLRLSEDGDTVNAAATTSGISVEANGGDDSVIGGSGADVLSGGAGRDTLLGGLGNDTLDGGAGNDTIAGGGGNDQLSGGADGDTFQVGPGEGADTITGGETGVDYDTIAFTDAAGGQGVDITFTGNEAGTYAHPAGGSGSFSQIEVITGSANDDSIDASATTTGSRLIGGAGNDLITGGAGADNVNADAGDDTVIGNAGNDTLNGDAGNDSLSGGTGDDWLLTGDGNDTADGGAGNDYLSGFTGADVLTGGAGNDTLFGGAGADIHLFGTGSGSDRIGDFDMTLYGGRTYDQLDVSDLRDPSGNPVNAWDVRVGDDGSGNAVLVFPGGEQVTLVGVTPAQVGSARTMAAMGIPCFTAGTLILTPQGQRPIETLAPGDLVLTRDGDAEPVLWTGQGRFGTAELEARPELRPVRIRAGALGNAEDLIVSPQHALLARHRGREVLVRARHLAELGDGRFRVCRGRRQVSYHHILLPRHAIVTANGAPAETLYPGPMALAALGPAARLSLALAHPGLAGAVFGVESAAAVYGLTARPVLTRRALMQAPGHLQPAPATPAATALLSA